MELEEHLEADAKYTRHTVKKIEKDEEGDPNVEKSKETTIQQTATEKEKSPHVSVGRCANGPGPSQEKAVYSQHCKYMSEKEKDKDAKSESDEAFTPMEDKTKESSVMYLLIAKYRFITELRSAC